MQELPINKANFFFKNMQDFNQTAHVGPQEPIVFIDNISFYFYATISVKNLMKQSFNGMPWLFHYDLKIFWVLRLNMLFKMQNTWIVQQFKNGGMWWFMTHSELQKYVSISFYFDFYLKIVCKTILQCLENILVRNY